MSAFSEAQILEDVFCGNACWRKPEVGWVGGCSGEGGGGQEGLAVLM